MSDQPLPWAAILALGLTQNIGYGTLYYSFSILAPDMAGGFGLSTEWISAHSPWRCSPEALPLPGWARLSTGSAPER